jgi:hypothetical protein
MDVFKELSFPAADSTRDGPGGDLEAQQDEQAFPQISRERPCKFRICCVEEFLSKSVESTLALLPRYVRMLYVLSCEAVSS